MGIRLEEQLRAVRIIGRHDCQPAMLPDRHIRLLHEAELVGVKPQRLVLVVDQHACQIDPHRSSLSAGHAPALGDLVERLVSRKWNL